MTSHYAIATQVKILYKLSTLGRAMQGIHSITNVYGAHQAPSNVGHAPYITHHTQSLYVRYFF